MKVGISSCLLGNNVRYNGGHAMDHYIHDILGKYVEWVPVCPEHECGLPVPREAMRLVGSKDSYRLVTIKTKIDHTDRILAWAQQKNKELACEDLCGFIFKTRSPSSSMRGIKIYSPKGGQPLKRGVGLFARSFMEYFPYVPVEDEGRLHDAALRENFIERIFAFSRWKGFVNEKPTIKGLIKFHTDHKLMLMAHSPKSFSALGNLVAHAKGQNSNQILTDYITQFLEALKSIATVKKNTNVLQHCMGYFKNVLSKDEKNELVEIIDNYHNRLIPLIVPIVILQHYVRKYDEAYLKRQYYLNPHPTELMLRNHV